MLVLYEKAKNECNYHADRFVQEVKETGGLAVAKERLSSDTPRTALYRLHKLGRLDICLEYLVLRTQFMELFTEEELDRARKRLRSLNFEIETRDGAYPKSSSLAE
jgi:hypothetical protein